MLSFWPKSVLLCITRTFMHPSHSYQISSYMANTTQIWIRSSDTATDQHASSPAYSGQSNSHRVHVFTSHVLFCLQATCTRRTSRLCPLKFWALKNLRILFNDLAVAEIAKSNSERKVNILGRDSVSHCEEKVHISMCLTVDVCWERAVWIYK